MVGHTYNPTTREMEIGRIVVQNQPGQEVSKTYTSPNKLGVVTHACNPSSCPRRHEQKDHGPRLAQGNQHKTLSEKITKSKKG
jgi:cytochrome c5